MTDPSPTAHRRRMVMAEAVMHHGSMRVGELAELAGVSTMTVYRDLVALEEAGVVQRDRGRVIAQACGLHEADAVFRLDQHRQDKQEMAARAAELIPPGSSLMLDDSTSSIWLLRALPQLSSMTVVTNSQIAAEEAIGVHGTRLILIGGQYHPWAHATAGRAALEQIRDLRAGFCVLSASGVAGPSCYHPHQDIAEVKRAMLASSQVRILLIDRSKLRRQALVRFADLTDFDHVVVDSRISPEDAESLRQRGVEPIIAPPLPAGRPPAQPSPPAGTTTAEDGGAGG